MFQKKIRLWLARFRGRTTLKLSDPAIAPVFRIGNRLEAEKIALLDYEKELLEQFLAQIRPGDTVLDIGANIGLYSLPAAMKTGAHGRVHSFEPVPLWFSRLAENLQMNHIAHVTLHNLGLSDQGGSCPFTLKNIQGSGMGSIMDGYSGHTGAKKTETIQVRLENGDDYLQQQGIPVPQAVKIDVEGAELRVLSGLRKTLSDSSCRFIMCEVHPQYLNTGHEAVEKMLAELGFACRRTEPRGQEYHLFALKNAAGN